MVVSGRFGEVISDEERCYCCFLANASSNRFVGGLNGMRRTYYYFKYGNGWLREMYDSTGTVHWIYIDNIKQAYRTASMWLIQHLIVKELVEFDYHIEERDCYQKLI